jgi:hypothetical protein
VLEQNAAHHAVAAAELRCNPADRLALLVTPYGVPFPLLGDARGGPEGEDVDTALATLPARRSDGGFQHPGARPEPDGRRPYPQYFRDLARLQQIVIAHDVRYFKMNAAAPTGSVTGCRLSVPCNS